MLISQRYPLVDDLGFPNGVRSARQRWAAAVRRDRTRSQRASVITSVIMTLIFSLLVALPWIIQRVTAPQRLNQRLSSNMPHGNAHLGAEYYNIAAAIVDSRGFSDPFVVESGPTAWMPPLLVWIQAGLIWMFDSDRYWVMLGVLTLKALLLSACAVAIVRQDWRRNDGWVAFGVYAAFIVAESNACFSFTHDSWLILAGVTATLFGLTKIDRLSRAGKLSVGIVIAWGFLGGMIALSSPVAGFTWAVGTTVCLAPRVPGKWVLAGLVSLAVVTPWAIRNQVVLGRFVPIKSNVFFEFDQSQAIDSDGLLDWKTMSSHPYHAGPEQDAYVQMGEIAYLDTKKERFLEQLAAQPDAYFRKVRNRLVATTLLPAGFSEYSRPSLTLPLRWFIYPWPALAAVGLVVFCRPLTSLQRWAIIVYVAYLTPYVICSYYPRYGFPLLVVKILLCYWAIERVLALVRHTRGEFA